MSDGRMWRTDDLGGLELFRATITEFAFRPHAHEEFFIALTEAGRAAPRYRGGTHVLCAGDMLVLNPEEAHAGGPPAAETWTYRALYPGPDLMRSLMAEFREDRVGLPEFAGDVVRDRDVSARLRRFHRLAERPGTGSVERQDQLMEMLVLLISRHAKGCWTPRSKGREQRAVGIAREYLREHATENVSLAALSRHAGLSLFHLSRVFREAMGMPPHAYQTQVRVRLAKSFLGNGSPIAEAADKAGFYDQAHLTRHFKRVVGLTPGEYQSGLGLRSGAGGSGD